MGKQQSKLRSNGQKNQRGSSGNLTPNHQNHAKKWSRNRFSGKNHKGRAAASSIDRRKPMKGSQNVQDLDPRMEKKKKHLDNVVEMLFDDPMMFGFMAGCVFTYSFPNLAYQLILYYCAVLFIMISYACVVGLFDGNKSDSYSVCAEEEKGSNRSLLVNDDGTNGRGKITSGSDARYEHLNSRAEIKGSQVSHTQALGSNVTQTRTDKSKVDVVEQVMICDKSLREFIPKNKIHNIETDHFIGNCLFMVRPPDSLSTSYHDKNVTNFFSGKQRRFEFQFQGKLKSMPTGPVFMCLELEWAPKFNMLKNALVGTALQFVKKVNKGFHYRITNDVIQANGQHEVPHLAFPVETCIDRFVQTKPGDTPPKLGGEIFEDPSMLKNRKKGGVVINWNLEDTFTLVVYSSYVDWCDWKIQGLPGIRPFLISSVAGNQPIALTFYSLPTSSSNRVVGDDSKEGFLKHYQCNKKTFANVEISHMNEIEGGLCKELLRKEEKQTLGEFISDQAELQSTVEDVDDDLAEGVYLRSNDEITLSCGSDNDCEYVSIGGIFAVLRSTSTNKFCFQKVSSSTSATAVKSSILHSGDVVMVKLIILDSTLQQDETRYLSTHRGWWLKWVKNKPKQNGYFIIDSGSDGVPIEIEASFRLRHKRYEGYEIGVGKYSSVSFGGRLLALKKGDNVVSRQDVDACSSPAADDNEGPLVEEGDTNEHIDPVKEQWIDNVHFKANLYEDQFIAADKESSITEGKPKEVENLAAMAWIELLDRRTRRIQRAYSLRYACSSTEHTEEVVKVCLRTGKQLVPLLQRARSMSSSIDDSEDESYSPDDSDETDEELLLESEEFGAFGIDEGSEFVLHETQDGPQIEVAHSKNEQTSSTPPSPESIPGNRRRTRSYDDVNHVNRSPDRKNDQKRRRKDWLLKPARLTYKATKMIGQGSLTATKLIGKGSFVVTKKIGKGSYLVTKKVVQGVAPKRLRKKEKPRRMEPKRGMRGKGGIGNRRLSRDHHKVVNKYMGRKSSSTQSEPVAGLSPPDQSVENVNALLSYISSPIDLNILGVKSKLDSYFMQGDAAELGIRPTGNVLHGVVVVRGLWESHWKEEFVALHDDQQCLSFYPPLSIKPQLVIAYEDIEDVKICNPDETFTPFPGLGEMLCIETTWKTHYILLKSEKDRDEFQTKLLSSVSSIEGDEGEYKNSFRTVVSTDPLSLLAQNQWIPVSDSGKLKRRRIFNARLMSFDIPTVCSQNEGYECMTGEVAKFVEKTLRSALSLSIDSLEEDPDNLKAFLNATCSFRTIPLRLLDMGSEETLCILLNLYQCLTQHALLIEGAPDRNSISQYMRTCCYEIDGDAFSLADLEFIIRNNMKPPTNAKNTQFVLPPKNLQGRLRQEIGFVAYDPRINLVLNNGMISNPKMIQIFTSNTFEIAIKKACIMFLRNQLLIDKDTKRIILPKVTEVFKADFKGSPLSIVSFCLPYVEEKDKKSLLCEFMKNPNQYLIRYQQTAWEYHTSLVHYEEND